MMAEANTNTADTQPEETEASAANQIDDDPVRMRKILTKKSTNASVRDTKSKKIIVRLLRGDEMEITCSGGRYTTGEELTNLVMDEVEIPEMDRSYFGLWVVSASLQLQLKPHHLPFKVIKKWPDILESFSSGDTFSEQPGLYLKRDAMVDINREKEMTNPITLKLLCDELAFNMAYSFYPILLPDAVEFAALALRAEHNDSASKGDIRNTIGSFLPPHLERKTFGWTWRRNVWKAYQRVVGSADQLSCQLRYLEAGFALQVYGSTFFYGGLEHEKPGMPDEVVRIGVNSEGIHVILDRTNVLSLSRRYNQFSYNSYESAEDGDSFLIEYDNGTEGKKQMVIWSSQAAMIDTLVTRFIEASDDQDGGALGRTEEGEPSKYFTLGHKATMDPSRRPSDDGLESFGVKQGC
eukprot:m.27753 g.27753  ORF g.27753 m.27753 type:complete len:409 (+) comp7931_c0_seq1:146-1372(+)